MVNKEQGKLLTVREVARRCNRSEEMIRRWIWSGKLPAQKLGNQLFVEEGEVSDVEKARRDGEELVFVPAPRLTDSEFAKLLADQKQLRDELFRRHGYFDTAELVRQSHEDD